MFTTEKAPGELHEQPHRENGEECSRESGSP